MEYFMDILRIVNILTLISLVVALIFKVDKAKQLQANVDKLKKSLEEMDEQAKLIVRTDMELNKTQEELDKKITGLYSLQEFSRIMSTTLEKNQIFRKVGAAPFEELGVEKAWAVLWDEKADQFVTYLVSGYKRDETEQIKSQINTEQELYLGLIRKGKTFSSRYAIQQAALVEKIKTLFKVHSFVIAPILAKEEDKGLILMGTENLDMTITEGDEELITILANQISQALDNSRLFEKTWQAQQDLEKKVEERTRELTFALDEVRKINKRKSDFISSVSHELRTPLTSIKGYAAILLAEKLGKVPDAVKERLEKINRHSDELVHMVNDLLDIARIEAGKTIMNAEPQNINEMIANVTDLIIIQCKNKNIKLNTQLPQDLPLALADRTQIERVLMNLIGNAVKFTPENGNITVTAVKKEDFMQVGIKDTGIGIPPESINFIFDEFYRVDNAVNQQVKGTGLGLSLVKNIIHAHRGKIWVESKMGEGSTFIFTLPIAQ
ncbi:MAG: ATP-binding protein [Candidatus Omnitrophota bacterium]